MAFGNFAGGAARGFARGQALVQGAQNQKQQRALLQQKAEEAKAKIGREAANKRIEQLQKVLNSQGLQFAELRAAQQKAGDTGGFIPPAMQSMIQNTEQQLARDLAIANDGLTQPAAQQMAQSLVQSALQGSGAQASAAARAAGQQAGAVASAQLQARPKVSFQPFTDQEGNRILAIVNENGELVSQKNLGRTEPEFQLGRFRADLALRAKGQSVNDAQVQALSPEDATEVLGNLRGPDFFGQLFRQAGAPGAGTSSVSAPQVEEPGGRVLGDAADAFGNMLLNFFDQTVDAEEPTAPSSVTIPVPGGPMSETEFAALLDRVNKGETPTEQDIRRLSREQLEALQKAGG